MGDLLAEAQASGGYGDLLMGPDPGAEARDDLMGEAPAAEGVGILGGDSVMQGGFRSPREGASPAGEMDQEGGDSIEYQDEHAEAALKIQKIQKGKAERARVKELKENEQLPGQKRGRAKAKPVHKRESERSDGEIKFYDGVGSHYSGQLLNGRPHGTGKYTFGNGNFYTGEFKEGQMTGKGELHFPGYGKFVADFKDGRALNGSFFFDDGLEYQPQGWKYCVEGDRRFYHEVVDPRFGLTDDGAVS